MSPPVAALTAGEAVKSGEAQLQDAGIENARLDAWLLAAHVLGMDPDQLRIRPETPLNREAERAFGDLLRRRATDRVPVSRLIGRREFWSLSFGLSPATLDPRPDSETLIEAARNIDIGAAPGRSVLDLGTGTGCLLLALLSEWPASWGVGIDKSEAAIVTARGNATFLGLADRARFAVGDWAAPIGDRFDIVISNPPYIPRPDIENLPPEVARHDPGLALDGGVDGLDAFRSIARSLPSIMRPAGHVILEIGDGQADAVRSILEDARLTHIRLIRDLAGRHRCLVASAAV